MTEGDYILLSDRKTFGDETLIWAHIVRVSGAEVALSLDQKSAVFGIDSFVIFEGLKPQLPPDANARIQAMQQREADLLQQSEIRNAQVNPIPQRGPETIVQLSQIPLASKDARDNLSDAERQMQIIFKDWSAR